MADTKKKSKTAAKKTAAKTTKKKAADKEEGKYVSSGRQKKSYAEKQQFYAICFIAAGILLCCFAFIPGIKVWASIRGALFAFFGVGFFLLTALMFIFGIIAATNKFSKSPASFVYLSLSLTCFFSSIIHILTNTVIIGGFGEWWQQLVDSAVIGWYVSTEGMHLTGGVLGALVGGLFLQAFGKQAALATVIIFLCVNTMLLTGLTFNIIGKSIKDVFLRIHDGAGEKREERRAEARERKAIKAQEKENERKRRLEEEAIAASAIAEAQKNMDATQSGPEHVHTPTGIDEIFGEREEKDLKKVDDPIASSSNPEFRFTNIYIADHQEPFPAEKEKEEADVEEKLSYGEGGQLTFDDDEAEKILREANDQANEQQKAKIDSVKNFDDGEPKKRRTLYKLPPVTCLNQPKFTKGDDFTSEMRSTSQKLVDTLKSFGVETTLVGVSRGPAVTRYELQPAPGVKISKITNLADDIALNLAASGVRIEAPIPNKSAVGIEVPNKTKSVVTLREMIVTPEFQNAKSKLNVALGKDITGNVRCADLAKMPHLLIAGTTGSGKSVLLNCMITSILYNATPSEVKLLMIDPKQVEFSVYNGIPHLLVPVISNVRKAAGALAWAVTEMENRYKSFSECAVRDITGFNRYCQSHKEIEPMPQIVIFIDELNDLMMISPKEVEDSICRIAQKARAAGMHLVVATQRPSVDVITGIIKANIPSRISLSVSSQVDSRTILDMIGAEKLLGNGDMLYNPVGISKPVRIQGAYLSDEEIEKIVDFIKSQETCEYDDEVMQEIERQATSEKKKGSAASLDDDDDSGRDEMLQAAAEVVVELGQASTTLLQRKLRLGYARAARIMDQLEQSGFVGPSEGSKPRKVLITKEQLMEMKAYAADND